ncbi:MAG: hypothetical protein WD231_01930 [Candidatus Woykebacteria bacterium]
MTIDEANRIDRHCNCGSREYAIPEYCEYLGIKEALVYQRIG